MLSVDEARKVMSSYRCHIVECVISMPFLIIEQVYRNTMKVSKLFKSGVPQVCHVITKQSVFAKTRCACLLRPVGADQSEQTGLFGRGILKRQSLKLSIRQRLNRCAAAMDDMRKIMLF